MNLYIPCKVFVDKKFLCTMPLNKADSMLRYLKTKNITNVTIK
jgi:hypothetical protein